MDWLNAILAPVTAALMAPFLALPAWVALVVWSAVAGVLMTWAFRYTSSQKALRRAIDQIRANTLGMKLFQQDLTVTLQCFAALMAGVGKRLLWSLPPMLVMIVPFVLILTQLAVWYEFRPLHVGEKAVVELRLAPEAWERNRLAEIALPDGLTLDTRGLIGPRGLPDTRAKSLSWRIHADRPGAFDLTWKLPDGSTASKRVVASDDRGRLAAVCPVRPGPLFGDQLLYPAERAFPRGSPVQEIRVRYLDPARSTPILGFNIPWWGTFLIVSILAAFVAKPFLKVQF